VGVDISQEMIRKADSLNRYAHCRYVVNPGTRLPFADASFSFIYSNIVLQHVPPRYSRRYLREFVRVLAPGGILVFGLQDSLLLPHPPLLSRIRRTIRIRGRIKDALRLGEPRMRMYCLPERSVRRALGSTKVVDVQLTNSAAKDFNGKLTYLQNKPTAGYISKQYCAVKRA
jgi:SAM-dependent methyltransferase